MIFDVVTLFPGVFQGPLDDGVLRRARRAGKMAVRIHDLRRFGAGPQRQVDDAPFGGGPGMVLKPEPFFEAVAWIRSRFPAANERVVLLCPRGPKLDHAAAVRLARYDRLVLLCGRYEGIDERVRSALADEDISVGEAVVTGGELPALFLIDSVARQIPGVLGNGRSAEQDSFVDGRLDAPCYTRPAEYRGLAVPAALLSGDHAAIARWRDEAKDAITRENRPDLMPSLPSTTAPSERPRGPS